MRSLLLVGWFLIGVVSSGCTDSVRPVLTEKELVHDLDLTGVWSWTSESNDGSADKDKRPSVELRGFDRNSSYDFQFGGTPDESHDYVMRVGRIGDLTIAEFAQADPSGPPIVHGLPVYVFAKLDYRDGTLTLRELDDQKCRKALEADKLPHFVHLGARNPDIEHTVMLATTAELQQFLTRRQNELFTGKLHTLRRDRR